MNHFGVSMRTTRDSRITEMRALKEFIEGVPVPTLMVAIIDNLEQRADFDPEQLERFSNQIGQIAHAAARSQK